MKQRLLILVQTPDLRNVGSFKELYRNQLMIDDSLDFDFHTVLSSLKILYPGNYIIISFKIS